MVYIRSLFFQRPLATNIFCNPSIFVHRFRQVHSSPARPTCCLSPQVPNSLPVQPLYTHSLECVCKHRWSSRGSALSLAASSWIGLDA